MLKIIKNSEIFWTQKPLEASQIKKINNYPIFLPKQTHSDIIEFVSEYKNSSIYADALITTSTNFFIGVKTADCVPILIIGDSMVGAVHAGWRGLVQSIVFKTLEKMDDLGCNIKQIFVGAHICRNCYEVGQNVANALPSYYKNEKYLKKISSGKYLLDLFAIVCHQVEIFNPLIKIEHMGKYTCCNNNLFYSYRKEKTQKRNLWA
ncbi:MAG TPA: laccase domain-containing protein, partial [Aquificae bacterium]|nr:laccase domain-containing protein [Aquificota bacterium]